MSKQRLGAGAEGATTYALALASHHHRAQRIGHTGASRKDRQATINEVSILKKVVHPNVIAYRDSFQTADMLCICCCTICMACAPSNDQNDRACDQHSA